MYSRVIPGADRSFRASTWIGLAEALAIPTGLLTAGLLTRSLGPAGYGLFTLAATVTATIQWSLGTMFSRATVRLVAGSQEPAAIAKSVLGVYLGASLAAAFAVFLLANSISSTLQTPPLAGYLRLFCIDIVIFNLAFGYRSVLIGMGRFEKRALAGGARWIARLAFVYLFLLLGFGITGAIWASICASGVELVISCWRSHVWPELRSFGLASQLLSLAAPLTLASICLRIFERADLFLFKYLGGTDAEAGAYGAAQNLTIVANIAMMSISPVVLSTLTRQLRDRSTNSVRETVRTYSRLILLMLPLAAIAAGAASEIIRAIFGPAFSAAGPVLALLLMGSIALVWFSLMNVILVAVGKVRWTYWLAAPMLGAAVVLDTYLIRLYGAPGAAAGNMIIAVVGAIAASILVTRAAALRFPMTPILQYAFVAALMYLASDAWTTHGVWLWIKLGLFAAAVPAVLALSSDFRRYDLPALRSIVSGSLPAAAERF